MSRQGGLAGVPPLFLTQRQHQQLERSFTDPYKRRIAELEEQIAELNKAGKFPVYADYLNDDDTAEDDSIFIFTWPDGAGEWSGQRITYVTDAQFEEDPTHELHISQGTKSAVLVFTARTQSIWYGDNQGNIFQTGQVISVTANYDSVYNNQIIHLH